MPTQEVRADHVGEFVVLLGPEGGKLARIPAEDAIKLAHEILDCAEKSLRGTGQLHEYE